MVYSKFCIIWCFLCINHLKVIILHLCYYLFSFMLLCCTVLVHCLLFFITFNVIFTGIFSSFVRATVRALLPPVLMQWRIFDTSAIGFLSKSGVFLWPVLSWHGSNRHVWQDGENSWSRFGFIFLALTSQSLRHCTSATKADFPVSGWEWIGSEYWTLCGTVDVTSYFCLSCHLPFVFWLPSAVRVMWQLTWVATRALKLLIKVCFCLLHCHS